MSFPLNLRLILFDVDDTWLNPGWSVELAVLDDAPQFAADFFQFVHRHLFPELPALHAFNDRQLHLHLAQVDPQTADDVDDLAPVVIKLAGTSDQFCLSPGDQAIELPGFFLPRDVDPLHQRANVLTQSGLCTGCKALQGFRTLN